MFDNLTGGQFLTILLFGIAAVLATGGIAMIAMRALDIKTRATAITGNGQVASNISETIQDWLAKVSQPFAKLAKPKEEHEIHGLKAKFAQAGWRSSSAMPLYFGMRAVLALVLPFFVLIFVRLFVQAPSANFTLFATLGAAALGYFLPVVVFERVRTNRQLEIFESFPDALDLMVVCVESGLGLDMAIARTGKELHVRSPALADEINLIGTELRMGASRERALRNFSSRTGLAEVSMFVAMILQADRFGTSIADALRVHADELRLRRRLRAEETAAKIPLKLLFPLIFMIFPALLLVLLGPAFISILKAFKDMSL